MTTRRTHSVIDNLPKTLQTALEQMLVDNIWPNDYTDPKRGKPTYKALESYCRQHGHVVSSSAIGRFGKQMRVVAMLKQRNNIVSTTMQNITSEDVSQTQKAVAELLTARAIDLTVSDKTLTSKQIKEIAQAIRDCANISIKADQYRQDQIKKKVAEATKNIEAIGKKEISPETLKMIREQIYGIVN